jgi:GNAT superfamily N-acetyltransferase
MRINTTPFSGSFGPIGEFRSAIRPVSAGRLKVFDTSPVTTLPQLYTLMDNINGAISAIRTGIPSSDHEDEKRITRLTLRVVVRDVLIRSLADALTKNGAKIEAAIPLRNGYAGMQLVYIGYNEECRRDPEVSARAKITRTTAEIQSLRRFERPQNLGITTRIMPGGISAFGNQTSEINQGALINMLKNGFNYSEQDAFAVLTSPQNIISVVYKDNTIVGMNVTEIRDVPIADGTTLTMAEITDCFIQKEHRRKGYHTRLLHTLANKLREMDIDVVFTESSIESQPMVNSTLRLGHMIAGDGNTIPGFLESHAYTESETQGSLKVNTLFVTYLPYHVKL